MSNGSASLRFFQEKSAIRGSRPRTIGSFWKLVGEGGGRLGGPDGTPRRPREAVGLLVNVQRDQRGEPEEQRCHAEHRWIRPLALGLDTQVGAALVVSRLHGPAVGEPSQHRARGHRRIGALEGFGIAAPIGITHQHPPDRYDRFAWMMPQGGAGGVFDPATAAPLSPARLNRAAPDRRPVRQPSPQGRLSSAFDAAPRRRVKQHSCRYRRGGHPNVSAG
jgi:hypothetical protein